MKYYNQFNELLHGGPVGPDDLARVRSTVVFEQPNLVRKLIRFAVLLILAAAISTWGLIGDSVATVIGAMIVAPLMLPLMGVAFSISIGSARAFFICLAVSVGGIAASIGTGFVISQLMPSSFDVEQVGQIMSRTAPNLVDMMAALATGLAGAFAMGRKDVSDTLPGVAIAIALVPPLANAGLLFGVGRSGLAFGSVLLFVTNYLAIVLTGAVVFGLMGYPQIAMHGRSSRGKRVAIALVAAMFVIVSVPLAYQSLRTISDRSAVDTATIATEKWLASTTYDIISVELDQSVDGMSITIKGSGELPDVDELAQSLKGELSDLDVVLEVIPAERMRIGTQ